MLSNQDNSPEWGLLLCTRRPRAAPPSLRPTVCCRPLSGFSDRTRKHRHWSGQKEREVKGAPETSGVGCRVWRLQPDPEGLLALLPVSLRGTMARHPVQVFVGVRAMREAQAEAAARCPLASGHSTPPERLVARPGELCGPCTAQIRNLAHALWPPKFLSMFSTLFPKEQARCQCLLWPKGRPANIAQDRLTVSSIGGAPQCHPSSFPAGSGSTGVAQGSPGGC